MLRVTVTTPGIFVIGMDPKELRKVLRKVGGEIAGVARRAVRKSKGTGRLYFGSGGSRYRPYKPGRHQASSPGQAPVSNTGTVLTGIKAFVFKKNDGVMVKDRAYYSSALEHGATGGGNRKGATRKQRAVSGRVLLPRPFLEPALKARENSLAGRIQDAVVRGVEFKKIAAGATI